MRDIKDSEPPLIKVRIPRIAPRTASDSNSTLAQISYERPFPLTRDLLEYPLIKSLAETDVSASVMEIRFKGHHEDIEALILDWRIKTEGYMAELIRKGRESDGLKKIAAAPVLPVGEFEPNPFDGISDDLKLLFRADSLFESASPKIPVSYDRRLESRDYWGLCEVQEEDSSSDEVRPLDLSKFKRHAKAQEVARALLKAIGKPDACFLELQNVGPRFKCGRCRTNSTQSWVSMVRLSPHILYSILTKALRFRFGTTWTHNRAGSGDFNPRFRKLKNSKSSCGTYML